LLGERNPESLVPPINLRTGARQLARVIKAFAIELAFALLSLAVLGAGAYYLGNPGNSHSIATLATVLGSFGVTAAALAARAKAQAQALFTELRTSFYSELVGEHATRLPAN
jgi:hypothetical protein